MSIQESLVENMFMGSTKLTNVKLFPGANNDVTASRVMEQVQRVFVEVENEALEIIELDD